MIFKSSSPTELLENISDGEVTNLFLNNVTFFKLNKNEVITAVEN